MTDRPIPPNLPEDPSAGRATPIPPVPPIPPAPPIEGAPAYDRGDQPAAPGRPKSSGVLYGRLAVGVGVILLGLVNFYPELFETLARGELWRLWPLVLIGFGVVKFATASTAKQRHGAAWLVVSGAVLLIHFVNLFGLSWGTGWPLWILGAGLIDLTFPEKARDRGIGLFLIALGAFLLLGRTQTLPDGWERAWPILVILFGVVLVWQALFTKPGSCGRRAGREEGRDHG